MGRHTSCILSTDNLLHNVAVLRATAPRAKMMAMVKANAYGHGLRSVGLRLDGHVDALGVASIDEALALRQAGVKASIVLIEGVFVPDELRVAAEQGFHVVFHDASQIKWLTETALPTPLTAWLKIDTGMGRLGFAPHETPAIFRVLSAHASVRQPIGIMSHLACADDENNPINKQQISLFHEISKQHNGVKSLCNSAALFSFPDHQCDWVRPGLALYGASPCAGKTAHALGLKPVMTLQTRLIAVKDKQRGDTIGYGARFTCPQDMRIGILAIGYGDGYPRSARDGTAVLVEDRLCPLVGRVSMDMAAVDLTAHPTAAIGAKVTLWGEGLPIESIASTTDHVAYDLLTGVQNRVKFHWQDRL